MSFKCKECNESVSNSKMAGLVFGQVARATLESKGIKTQAGLTVGFSANEFGAGFLSALRVECPSCKKTNWS